MRHASAPSYELSLPDCSHGEPHMMSPLWQRAARDRVPLVVGVMLIIAAAVSCAATGFPAVDSPYVVTGLTTAALVFGTWAWHLSTVMRLTVLVAVQWPLLLAAVSVPRWPWVEALVLVGWMWLSEILHRWRTRNTAMPVAAWRPIEPAGVSPAMQRLRWPLSLTAVAAVPVALWCGESWSGAAVIAAGLLLVCHETGQVRRSLIAIACGMGIISTVLQSDSRISLMVLLPLAVPVLRAGGVATAYLFPGAAIVTGWHGGWHLPGSIWSIATMLAALAITGWVWDAVAFSVRPAWRLLPPSWRWFTWAKLTWDPVFRLLAADPRPWGRVLDLGCGTGLGGVIAAQRGDVSQWRGIDLDARKLNIARRVLAVTPMTSGWQTLHARVPLGVSAEIVASADTLLALDILHYWPLDEQADLLVWMRSLLTAEGVLWLREGTTDAAGAAQVHRGERFTTSVGLNPASALFFRSTAEWESAFVAAGFTIVSRQTAGSANCLWSLSAAPSQDLLA